MFNPKDFFEFIKELGSFACRHQEAKKRVIVSRMYYAPFLMIRGILKTKLQSTPVKSWFDVLYTDSCIHGVVMEALEVSDIHTRNLLHTLRRKRNDADYKLRSKNWDREIGDVTPIANELIVNTTSNLPQKFSEHISAIQDIVEKWFIRKSKRYQQDS